VDAFNKQTHTEMEDQFLGI